MGPLRRALRRPHAHAALQEGLLVWRACMDAMAAVKMAVSPLLDPQRVSAPAKFVEPFGAFSLDDGREPVMVRPLEAAPEKVFNFSEVSRPETIRSICKQKVPGWARYSEDQIAIDQICEGLSNQLFKVHVDMDHSEGIPCVLFRIYGKDVGTLYDQEKEMSIFLTLSKYQIAPKMYANGEGWRIEEWHFARPLKTRYMCNPSILAQVAAQLARFHKLSYRSDFPRHIVEMPPASLARMESWGLGARRAAEKLRDDPESARRLARINLSELLEEGEWLRSFVLEDDPQIRGSGLDIVFSHSDVQENNILQTQYGLRFIDFEYSSMEYQAFDIANYFCECTTDYTYEKYPFYKLSLSDFPAEWEQRLFCAIYLSEYLEMKVKLEDLAVTRLLKRVHRFTLMSHYLWAVWAIIRAPQAWTFNEFDFLHYSQARWDSYRRQKHALLESTRPGGAPRERQQSFSERVRKTPYILGGALTASGMLLGACAVVVVARLIRR